MSAAPASVAPNDARPGTWIWQILPHRRWWWRILLVGAVVHLLMLAPAFVVLWFSPSAAEYTGRVATADAAVGVVLWLLALWWVERWRGHRLLQAAAQWQSRIQPSVYRAGWRAAMWGDRASGVTALRDLATVRACVAGPGFTGWLDFPWVPVYIALGGWIAMPWMDGTPPPWVWLTLVWLGVSALAPLCVVVMHRADLQACRQALRRIQAYLLPGAWAHPQLIWHPADPDEALVLDEVSAWVPGAEQAILPGLSLVVPRGQLLAIVGPSGAGKTTLGRVVAGVWPCAFGGIWRAAAQGQLGYLPQEVALLPGTVADNIAGLDTPDRDAVVAAAQRTGLHELVLRLPKGYDTVVGEGGYPVSAGLCQRIGLARATYRRPRLLILDEPATHLDEAGELALESLLQTLRQEGCSVILLTQARAMLRVVDRILILEGGRFTADEDFSQTSPVSPPGQLSLLA